MQHGSNGQWHERQEVGHHDPTDGRIVFTHQKCDAEKREHADPAGNDRRRAQRLDDGGRHEECRQDAEQHRAMPKQYLKVRITHLNAVERSQLAGTQHASQGSDVNESDQQQAQGQHKTHGNAKVVAGALL